MKIEPLANKPEVLREFLEIETWNLLRPTLHYADMTQQLAYYMYLYDTEFDDFIVRWYTEEVNELHWNGAVHKEYYKKAQQFVEKYGDELAIKFIEYVHIWNRLGRE